MMTIQLREVTVTMTTPVMSTVLMAVIVVAQSMLNVGG
jgi:hypothetical protein